MRWSNTKMCVLLAGILAATLGWVLPLRAQDGRDDEVQARVRKLVAEMRPDLSRSTAGMSLDEKVSRLAPTEREDKWLRIRWRRHPEVARRDAARLGVPIFLWLMDGDPLGCT